MAISRHALTVFALSYYELYPYYQGAVFISILQMGKFPHREKGLGRALVSS